jgi:hypothetical protein
VAGGTSMVARTNGHQRWPSGRRGTRCLREAGELASSAEGRRSRAIDGESCGRIRRPASMAVGLNEELLLEDEFIEAGLFPSLDINDERWWWPATTSRDSGQRSGERCVSRAAHEETKWEREVLPTRMVIKRGESGGRRQAAWPRSESGGLARSNGHTRAGPTPFANFSNIQK